MSQRDDDSALATKGDVKHIVKTELDVFERRFRKEFKKELKEELVHEFKIITEDLRSDFRAYGDVLMDHDTRLKTVEVRVGIR